MTETSKYSKYCCGLRLKDCNCGHNKWICLGDFDCGDWDEERFKCDNCGKIIYIELPD